MASGLSCSEACGIFLDQGLDLCPLQLHMDSYPLYLQGSPEKFFLCGNEGGLWLVVASFLMLESFVLVAVYLSHVMMFL